MLYADAVKETISHIASLNTTILNWANGNEDMIPLWTDYYFRCASMNYSGWEQVAMKNTADSYFLEVDYQALENHFKSTKVQTELSYAA